MELPVGRMYDDLLNVHPDCMKELTTHSAKTFSNKTAFSLGEGDGLWASLQKITVFKRKRNSVCHKISH